MGKRYIQIHHFICFIFVEDFKIELSESKHSISHKLLHLLCTLSRFWWLKIEALAEAGDWHELEKFSKSKKSPIGYDPFVEVCVKYERLTEAEKYLQRVQPEHKVKCLIKMG